MARRKNPSIAASLVAQAKARAESSAGDASEVVHLTDRERLHSRVDRAPDPETGAARLRVIIPGDATPEIYDFSRLLAQPEIADMVTCFAA